MASGPEAHDAQGDGGAEGPLGVAIIGMACRFPGAEDIPAFWANLRDGVESIHRLTPEELAAAGVSESEAARDDYVAAAPVIADHDRFDAGFFAYSPREARLMDPQQRLALEEALRALDDAAIDPARHPGRIGVFAGAGGLASSYFAAHAAQLAGPTGGLEHLASDKDFLATRIAYKLGLTGPAITVQTACSTSLVATHLARQAILNRECDIALAGASTVRIPHFAGYRHREGDIRSPDGHCRAYDAAASGTVFGSGVGFVVLKHVEDALADGDRIYAVLRATAVNNDGDGKMSYTASSTEGMARAMVDAFAEAEIAPSQIGLVEGHGAGTTVGDPLEVEALRRVWATDGDAAPGGARLGSVKTNLGHLEQTAGVAALIKAALAVERGEIPPSLNFDTPNPRIDTRSGPFRIPTELERWPRAGRRRAAVNALGLGGTNAFAILEEAPAPVAAPVAPADGRAPLLLLSAHTRSALAASVADWRAALDAGAAPADLARTSARRAPRRWRLAASGGDAAALSAALGAAAPVEADPAPRKLVFLFPGQGAQRAGMGADLHRDDPVFRAAFDACADHAATCAGLDLRAAAFEGRDLARTRVTQPALFAVVWGLACALRAAGLTPDAVLGHSLGAYPAAALAGLASWRAALDLVIRRAALMDAAPEGGAMAAILADAAEVASLLEPGAVIAAINGPGSTVVSGDAEAVGAVIAAAEAAGLGAARLDVSHAFHSPHMAAAAAALAPAAAASRWRAPGAIAFISDRSGAALSEAPAPADWADHVTSPVRFADGLRALAPLGPLDIVEVGPGGALRAFAAGILPDARLHGTLGAEGALRATLGALWSRGRRLTPEAVAPRGARVIAAPLTRFEGERHMLPPPSASAARDGRLIGPALRLPGGAAAHQSLWSVETRPWAADHRVYDAMTLPTAAALIAFAELGARTRGAPAGIEAISYADALTFGEDEARLVHIAAEGDALSLASAAESGDDAAFRTHLTAKTAPAAPPPPPVAPESLWRGAEIAADPAAFYEELARIGLVYGPRFRAVRKLRLGPGLAVAHVAPPPDASPEEAGAALHPALLDACLHIFPAVSGTHGDFSAPAGPDETFLPIGVERFRLHRADAREAIAVARLRPDAAPETGRYTLDIDIRTADGAALASIEGLEVKRIPRAAFAPVALDPGAHLYAVEWEARPAPESAPDHPPSPAPGLWLLSGGAEAGQLETALNGLGAETRRIDAPALADAAARDALARDLAGEKVAALVIGDPLEGAPLMRLDAGALAREERRAFDAVTGAVRFLSEHLGDSAARLHLVTRGAAAPLEDAFGGEAAQAIWAGAAHVAALEHPGLAGLRLDIDHEAGPEQIAAALAAPDGEEHLALRAGARFAPRLARRPLTGAPAEAAPALDPDRSVLITGGLGHLGLLTARQLVERHGARRLVLAARRAPDAAAAEAIRALEALGAEVETAQLDIADEGAIRALARRRAAGGAPLGAVFHCAGLLDDAILTRMTPEQFTRVLRPKTIGALALHRATREDALSHFVVYSSILSLTGSMGQLNYVAGNAFLDALTAHRRRLGLPATALNWGPWEDAGLATDAGEAGRAVWRARGTRFIPAGTGLAILDRALAHGPDHVGATLTEWPIFLRQFPEPPKLYTRLADPAAALAGRLDREAARAALDAAGPGARRAALTALLRGIAARTLELPESFSEDASLRDAGLDSLMSITVINEIEAALGPRLPARALLAGPSLADLTALVAEAAPELIAGDAEEAPGPGAAAAAAAAAAASRARAGRSGDWLVVRAPRQAAKARLFCFPFAGGGSAAFDRWAETFSEEIEVVAIEPPGRLARIDEAPVETAEEFARAVARQMIPRLDLPYGVFGHCLGGLTLYETVRTIVAREGPAPAHVFASGAKPPQNLRASGLFEKRLLEKLKRMSSFDPTRPAYLQQDEIFMEVVRAFGIRDSVKMMEQVELRELILPTVRAEFAMASAYFYVPEGPLPAPVTVFRGAEDAYFTARDAEDWRALSGGPFRLWERPGGHFAVVEDLDFLRARIEETLLAAARPAPAADCAPA